MGGGRSDPTGPPRGQSATGEMPGVSSSELPVNAARCHRSRARGGGNLFAEVCHSGGASHGAGDTRERSRAW